MRRPLDSAPAGETGSAPIPGSKFPESLVQPVQTLGSPGNLSNSTSSLPGGRRPVPPPPRPPQSPRPAQALRNLHCSFLCRKVPFRYNFWGAAEAKKGERLRGHIAVEVYALRRGLAPGHHMVLPRLVQPVGDPTPPRRDCTKPGARCRGVGDCSPGRVRVGSESNFPRFKENQGA